MKKIMIAVTLVAAALNIVSCNPKELVESFGNSPSTIDYLNGDTTKITKELDPKILKKKDFERFNENVIVVDDVTLSFKGIKLHGKPLKKPDLTKLKNTKEASLKGKNLEYISIGSSLTAGVRDGGYYNESILTSYPALIARQLDIAVFESPVFDALDYNGVGRKVISNYNPTAGPVKKMSIVSNNTGVLGFDEKTKTPNLKKTKLNVNQIHNFGIPNLTFEIPGSTPLPKTAPFIGRLSDEKGNKINSDGQLKDEILKRKFDFFTIEMGSESFSGNTNDINYAGYGQYFVELSDGKTFDEFLFEKFYEIGAKGVFANLPYRVDLPYFKQIPCEMLDKSTFGAFKAIDCQKGLFVFPNGRNDSLVSSVVNINQKDRLIKSYGGITAYSLLEKDVVAEKGIVDRYNKLKAAHAAKYNYPVVDLNGLFQKVLKNEFVTDDGVRADSNWPGGNFFSSDGMFPTAFGHAIIANEFIKVINSHYKTDIPLILTAEYLTK
jgi:hypothetical protein